MDCLLAPRSVAVIGASEDVIRIGGLPIAAMRAALDANQLAGKQVIALKSGRTQRGTGAFETVLEVEED